MDPRMTCIDHKNMNVLIKLSMRCIEIGGTDTSVTVFYILIL